MRLLLLPVAIAASVVVLPGSASAQRVALGSNGNLKVEFPGPCTVHYDRNGRLQYAERSCNSSQRYSANRAIADYVRGNNRPGWGNNNGNWNSHGGQGQYRIMDIRYDRVRFADNCRVYYDRLGRHLRSDGGCNSNQRTYADRAMANWRRSNGYYPGGNGFWGQGSWNDVNITPTYDGGSHVRFRNGCDVYYNRWGNRIRADAKCTSSQRQRADAAIGYYGHGIRN